MARGQEMLEEGGRLSAGFNWTVTLCVLPLPLIFPPSFTADTRIIIKADDCHAGADFQGAWNDQSQKLRWTVKAPRLVLSFFSVFSLPRPHLVWYFLPACCLNLPLPPSLPPFSSYFNLGKKWNERPLNFIASRKLWWLFIVVSLFAFGPSAGGLDSWHIYTWRPTRDTFSWVVPPSRNTKTPLTDFSSWHELLTEISVASPRPHSSITLKAPTLNTPATETAIITYQVF